MAIWPYGHNMVLWPYSHMAIWHQSWTIWVFLETATQMQQSGEVIRTILTSCKKLKQKWNDGIFSFVFFGNSFVNRKIAGTSRILLTSLPIFFCGLIMLTHKYSQLRRKNCTHIGILTHPTIDMIIQLLPRITVKVSVLLQNLSICVMLALEQP
jgi:hypothetical protein